MADLAQLQRTFYDRCVRHAPEGDLIASGDIAVYARMYASRLYDTLADDYPKLRVALGEDRFGEVVVQYLRAHPPSSFTLRDCGLALPGFLRGADFAPPWAADLAALERARLEVFDGPDAEPMTQESVAALGEQLYALGMAWVPSSVVVPIAWTVDDLWSEIEDATEDATEGATDGATEGERPTAEPEPASRVVLVWRRDIAVLHRTLDDDEARLAAPIAGGTTFAAVCEVLGELHGDDASARAVELLVRWLGAQALVATASSSQPAQP